MRYIAKGIEPIEFSDWKALENEDWKPNYNELSGLVKTAVYNSLIEEQKGICCYCERELATPDYHIEHLNPQHKDEGDDLDYSNLLCSCLNKTTKGAPLHCGKLKGHEILPITPLQNDCQSKFEYTAMGEILGVNEEANRTIHILGLDIEKLVRMREFAASPFISEELDDDEFISFVEGYVTPNQDGSLNPFCSMIEFLFM